MAVEPGSLEQFSGKRINLKVVGKDEAEGTAELANEVGVLFKRKGTSVGDLVEASTIESISFVETDTKPLEAAVLQPIEFGRARRHLADRHGYVLAHVNTLTEAEALQIHNQIDHEESGLGHVHKAKADGATAQAVASTEDQETAADAA